MRKQPGDQAAIDAALQSSAPKAFDYLEGLAGGAFLIGDALSIADIAVVSNLLLFNYLGHRIDEVRYPKLTRYFRTQLGSAPLANVLKDEKPVVQSMGLDASILS
jgi:glutathione S-transferase